MSLASQPSPVRQHPATSALHLGPYLAHKILVEWYDPRGRGPCRGELEKLSAERPYVKGYKHSVASFENLLPVLRPLSDINRRFVGTTEPLAVAVARLLLDATPEEKLTFRAEAEEEGAVVYVTAVGRNEEQVEYCTVRLAEWSFAIQGPRREFLALQNVLQAYELLRAHHIAVGLSPGQYAPF